MWEHLKWEWGLIDSGGSLLLTVPHRGEMVPLISQTHPWVRHLWNKCLSFISLKKTQKTKNNFYFKCLYRKIKIIQIFFKLPCMYPFQQEITHVYLFIQSDFKYNWGDCFLTTMAKPYTCSLTGPSPGLQQKHWLCGWRRSPGTPQMSCDFSCGWLF